MPRKNSCGAWGLLLGLLDDWKFIDVYVIRDNGEFSRNPSSDAVIGDLPPRIVGVASDHLSALSSWEPSKPFGLDGWSAADVHGEWGCCNDLPTGFGRRCCLCALKFQRRNRDICGVQIHELSRNPALNAADSDQIPRGIGVTGNDGEGIITIDDGENLPGLYARFITDVQSPCCDDSVHIRRR